MKTNIYHLPVVAIIGCCHHSTLTPIFYSQDAITRNICFILSWMWRFYQAKFSIGGDSFCTGRIPTPIFVWPIIIEGLFALEVFAGNFPNASHGLNFETANIYRRRRASHFLFRTHTHTPPPPLMTGAEAHASSRCSQSDKTDRGRKALIVIS